MKLIFLLAGSLNVMVAVTDWPGLSSVPGKATAGEVLDELFSRVTPGVRFASITINEPFTAWAVLFVTVMVPVNVCVRRLYVNPLAVTGRESGTDKLVPGVKATPRKTSP